MSRGTRPALARACGGASAVEFALVLPMFLTLVFGGIEFGRLLWTKEALQETAIAGARCMAIAQGATQDSPCASGSSYSATSTKSYIQTVASGWGVTVPTSGIALYPTGNASACTGLSQVTLTSTFYSVAPSLVQLAAGGTTLTATACFPNNS